MKKQSLVIMILIVAALGVGWVMWGKSQQGAGEKVMIVATDNGWDSQKVHNAIAKLVVEHAYDGYQFKVSTASTSMNWQSLMGGDVDLDIESWTDNVASYQKDVERGDVIPLGVLVPDSMQGIYVPRYVVEGDAARGLKPLAPDLKKVGDLKKYANVFPDPEEKGHGRIYGAIPGWMSDGILHKKYLYYGLDKTFNYIRLGSEATLFASLSSAYNKGEPWVGYCYEPAWVVGQMDLLRLEDAPYSPALFQDGKCDFPATMLMVVSNKHFPDKAPNLTEFFKKYQTGSALISSALAHLSETHGSHEEAAIWFLKNNDALLDDWLPAENAKKLRDYLSTQ